MVYINSKNPSSREHLSPLVIGSLDHTKMGKTIPKAVLCSPDQTQIYTKMSYKQLDVTSEYSKASKLVKAALKGDVPAPDPTTVPAWNLKNVNAYFQGEFIELTKDNVLVCKGMNGGNRKENLNKFSAGTIAYAKFLQQQKSGEQEEAVTDDENVNPEKTPSFTLESWESAKGGKVIKGTFVSLKGDKISITKENGKTSTFALKLLSEKSQKRARELASEKTSS